MTTMIGRRRTGEASLARLISAICCLAAALCALTSAQALAMKTHPYVSQFRVPGENPGPAGIAVNESTHRVFVTDTNARVIYQLNPNGTPYGPKPQLNWIASSGLSWPQSIAVDNTGGSFAGYLYVASAVAHVIQQYTPAGDPSSVKIEASAIPPNGTSQAGGLPNVVNPGEFRPMGIAVDGSGNVLVWDAAAKAIDKFSPSGAFMAQLASGSGFSEFESIAIGPSSEIFAGNGVGLFKFDSAGVCVNSCSPITANPVNGVATNSAGDVLASVNEGGSSQVDEFDSSGVRVSTSGAEKFNKASKIALDQTSGTLYVLDQESDSTKPVEPTNVKVFGALITLPDATTEAASAVTGSGAEVHGIVNADGGPPATCVFQYVDEEAFASKAFVGAKTAPCAPAGPFSGEADAAVHAVLSGLNGGTTYHYRLFATNSNGSNPGKAMTFTTLGPSIRSQAFSSLTETGVMLEAVINPRSEATEYHFEFVDEGKFGESEWAAATEVPVGGAEIPAGGADVPVSQAITGLIPGTGYHFRAVASNPGGEAVGPGMTFRTFASSSSSLPDGRAYEQASPVDKNGSNVGGSTDTVQAALDGNGVIFYSNAGLPGGEGAQNFPLFLATRSGPPSPAWTTQGLFPPASTGPRAILRGWAPDFAWSYSGNYTPGGPGTFFARESATHGVTQIATGLSGVDPLAGQPVPAYAGTSADDSAVVFEDSASLVSGAKSGKPNVYLWDRSTGSLSLVDRLNNGLAPTQGAFAGPYDWFGIGAFGAGAAGNYYTQDSNVISRDGTRVFFTAANNRQVYVRINPTQAQSTVDGAGNCLEPAKACTVQISKSQAATPDPLGEKPAIFNQATPDGRFALFMSSAKLTDDATTGPTGEGRDLYRYDVSTDELVDLTPDTSDTNGAAVQGVIGMSDDGSYVYFVANGVLASGGSAGSCAGEKGNCSLYVWHEGVTEFIAPMRAGQATESDLANWLPTPVVPAHRVQRTARVDPGGKVLLFRSFLQLTGYDNRGKAELYRYEAKSGGGTLNCISCNPTNLPPTGNAGLQSIPEPFAASASQASFLTRNLSAGGNRIFFDTADKLVATDVNGVNDVYEWEASGTGSCQTQAVAGGCLFLISTGTSPIPSYFGDAAPTGSDAFFFTRQSLVAQDRDDLQDVYDARVGGGIAAQNAREPTPCGGETCLGPGSSPTVVAPPASTGETGSGNVKPLHCRKGEKKVRRKGRTVCVKKHRHGKKHQHRGSSGTGRAAR